MHEGDRVLERLSINVVQQPTINVPLIKIEREDEEDMVHNHIIGIFFFQFFLKYHHLSMIQLNSALLKRNTARK